MLNLSLCLSILLLSFLRIFLIIILNSLFLAKTVFTLLVLILGLCLVLSLEYILLYPHFASVSPHFWIFYFWFVFFFHVWYYLTNLFWLILFCFVCFFFKVLTSYLLHTHCRQLPTPQNTKFSNTTSLSRASDIPTVFVRTCRREQFLNRTLLDLRRVSV